MPTVNKPIRPWMKPKIKAPDNNQGRSNANRELYGSNRWKKVSAAFRRANPLCAECLKNDTLTQSKVTDHIKPVNDGVDPWDQDNWQALCISCHQKKSRSERK